MAHARLTAGRFFAGEAERAPRPRGENLSVENRAAARLYLTPPKCVRIMSAPHADVAELADAQVSEACDGDIVEVQVLSSAPISSNKASRVPFWTRVFIH